MAAPIRIDCRCAGENERCSLCGGRGYIDLDGESDPDISAGERLRASRLLSDLQRDIRLSLFFSIEYADQTEEEEVPLVLGPEASMIRGRATTRLASGVKVFYEVCLKPRGEALVCGFQISCVVGFFQFRFLNHELDVASIDSSLRGFNIRVPVAYFLQKAQDPIMHMFKQQLAVQSWTKDL